MIIRYKSISKDWMKSLLSHKRKRQKKNGEKANIKGKKLSEAMESNS